MNPETKLYSEAIKLAFAHGFTAWRENSGRRAGVSFGFKGKPDIGGHHRRTGQALYWECKHEDTKRRITQEQWEFMLLAHKDGCHVRVFTNLSLYELHQVPDKLLPTRA